MVVSLGHNVTIHCENQTSAETFYLLKAGDQKSEQMKEISQNNSSFTIRNVTLEHTGKYTCRYSNKLDCFFTSKSSVPMELLLTDPELSRPGISLNSSIVSRLRSSVSIQCWVKKGQSGIFYLHNAEDKTKLQSVKSQENMAKFIFKNIRREDSGNYSCSYRPTPGFLISPASNSNATLLILDPDLPSPTISISPIGLVALGQEIKIQCETKNGPMMFYLYEAGDPTAKWTMKSDFDMGEFSISNLSSQHRGMYHCIYARVDKPFLFSGASEPLELQVSGMQESYDYTQANIARFIIGSLILLVLTYIIFVECNID
ncbi:immunoglobulin superfamily member 1-like [Sceloporus undulatus]|uniref:immunoglobulin superfamily member 1-like n=1 Tax=Sceloporus undulatus TaxID=8520 RepID=UPI001C4BFD72|nr:immunoglobulin superfamily member 1-like [Sceloporus undulatus]